MIDQPLTPQEIQLIRDSFTMGDEVEYAYPSEILESLDERGLLQLDPVFRRGKVLNFLTELWRGGELDFADRIVAAMGSGMYGAAYLLTDGNILKLTWDDGWEMGCVAFLVANNIIDPHLPKVYEYGGFPHDDELFYYIREPLDDIPEMRSWRFDALSWSQVVEEIAQPLEAKYGIDIRLDARPANFGVRPGEPEVFVLRDVSCKPIKS